MKKVLLVLALFAFALSASALPFSLTPPTNSSGLPFNFSTCGVITHAGNYYLKTPLLYADRSPCITIKADNVNLNCLSASLAGKNAMGVGIKVTGKNVFVKRCALRNFSFGVLVDNALNTTLYGLGLASNTVGFHALDSSVLINSTAVVWNSRWDYLIGRSTVTATHSTYDNYDVRWLAYDSVVELRHSTGALFYALNSQVSMANTNFTVGHFTNSQLTQGASVYFGELIED